MKIYVTIDCDNIGQFYAHLTELAKQVKRTARKQKLNPAQDEFQGEHTDSLYDDNCYGTHSVEITIEENTRLQKGIRAIQLMRSLLPEEDYGENGDCEELYNIIKELADNATDEQILEL